MVLPLLAVAGLMAAGGTVGNSFLEEAMEKRKGARNANAIDGIDPNNRAAMDAALLGTGSLAANDFSNLGTTRFEGGQNRANQRTITGMQQAGANSRAAAAQSAAMARQIQAQQHQTKINEHNQAVLEAQGEVGGHQYGANWAKMDGEDRVDARAAESNINRLQDTYDFVQETTALGRAATPEETAYQQAMFNTTILPALQQMTESGAMQEAELELFVEWGGDPFKATQVFGAEQGKLRGIIDRLKGSYVDHATGWGYNPQTFRPLNPGAPAGHTPFVPTTGPDVQSAIPPALAPNPSQALPAGTGVFVGGDEASNAAAIDEYLQGLN